MPSPRTVPTDLAQLITDTLALYNGIFTDVRIEQRFAPGVPLVRLDPEQIRRVIINLVDNAIEAMERRGQIVVETQLDAANSVVRVDRRRRRPGHSGRPSARSCSCRTTRPSGAAAASAWRSCAASSPSTAAASRSATTRRAARGLQSSCRAEDRTVEPRTHEPLTPASSAAERLMKPTILIVDDEPGVRTRAERRAARRGLQRRGRVERRGVPRARHARRRST